MFPSSHKTVFVLDHTPYFGISSENNIEFDLSKSRGPGYVPLPPISKSLWTCSVEAAVEYCRIVWDLFPQGKLVRFVVSDTAAHILNTWNPAQQNLTHISNAMCLMGVPGSVNSVSGNTVGGSPSVVPGLRAAVEALAEPSTHQQARMHKDLHTLNRCRIICVTCARDDASMRSLVDIVHTVLLQQNKSLHSQMIRIHHCHLVILNIYPANVETQVNSQPLREVNSSLSVEIHSVGAGKLAARLLRLLMPHYNLASTTVTGIPMKEEQNASSSANYDVEILHSANAHCDITKSVTTAPNSFGDKSKQDPDTDYETVTLRWCTPRGSWGEWGACGQLHRVTPLDVASRPSACLVNFLLNGRSVMLEMPRKGGGKVMSHVLAAHGGEIFIQVLGAGRSALEEPPSVSEGPGGRVTDYRIKDFSEVMQHNKLAPLRGVGALAKAKAHLVRYTVSWPLTLSSTLLFSSMVCEVIDPLPRIMIKETLSEEEVMQCKRVIFNLVDLESRHEPSTFTSSGHRSKGARREEQWRQVWGELEALVRGHQSSPGHHAVLLCLRDCRANSDSGGGSEGGVRASVIRATTDSPMSPPATGSAPPLPSAAPQPPHTSIYTTPRSILDLVISNESARTTSKRMDFAGRLANPSGVATLYPHLPQKQNEEQPPVQMEA